MDRQTAAGYLAGLIDGEGSVVVGRWGPKQKKNYRVVICVNTDPSIIAAAERACTVMRYAYVTYKKPRSLDEKRKDIWQVTVYRAEAIRRLIKEVPIQAEKKRQMLEQMVAGLRPDRTPDEALLRRYYVDEQLPIEELLYIFDVSYAQLHRHLKRCRISRARRDNIITGKARARLITKDGLLRLYVEDKLPLRDICEGLGVTSDTLYYQLRKHGIPRTRYRR